MNEQVRGMTCNILFPAKPGEVLLLNERVYEIFAPGTSVMRTGNETRIWRGLYVARQKKPDDGERKPASS